MNKAKKVVVEFEVPVGTDNDQLHEFLCQSLCELATDLSQEMFGCVDVIIDVGDVKDTGVLVVIETD